MGEQQGTAKHSCKIHVQFHVLEPTAISALFMRIGGCRRLHFCDAAAQRRGFEAQLGLARHAGLPLFLHMRAAAADFTDIMRRSAGVDPGGERAYRGVVHSFTGTVEELWELLALQPPLAIGAFACACLANRCMIVQDMGRLCDARVRLAEDHECVKMGAP